MIQYRQNLSGDMAFKSFIPMMTTAISIEYTPEMLILLNEAKALLSELNSVSSKLNNEQIKEVLLKECELSWLLASGETSPLCYLAYDNSIEQERNIEDQGEINDLYESGIYGINSLNNLPISGRLLRNCHYIMCNSPRYEKKYPGEFRTSPIWIGKSESLLKDAQFVPPVYDDMIKAFTDLEMYIHEEDSETDLLIKAAIIHYQFEMIHPFIDGNGRIGRLLNTLYLLENRLINQPTLIISYALKKRKIDYYSMLQKVNNSGNYNAWIIYFLNAIKEAAIYSIQEIVIKSGRIKK